MRIKVFVILAILSLFSFSVYSETTFMSDRHKEYGVECSGCHNTEKPKEGSEVSTEKCMECHGTYVEIQEQTKKLEVNNPHNNHLGEVDCFVCHMGHSVSESYCNSCHENLHKMK